MNHVEGSPKVTTWTPSARGIAFVLGGTSIWCLLAEFYGLCPMRLFAIRISLPALVLLAGWGLWNRRVDGAVTRAVGVGMLAGLLAAVAYDVFRLPFVFAREWGIAAMVPPMPLFKVFPRFGAMLLAQPIERHAPDVPLQQWGDLRRDVCGDGGRCAATLELGGAVCRRAGIGNALHALPADFRDYRHRTLRCRNCGRTRGLRRGLGTLRALAGAAMGEAGHRLKDSQGAQAAFVTPAR